MGSAGNLIIYRLGSLGDTVVALPCFHAIRRAFPDHTRIVLTNIPVSSKAAPLESILGGGGLIDGAIAYPVATRKPTSLVRLALQIRALKADTLIYMMGGRGLAKVRRDLAFFRLCGLKNIIGAPKSEEDDEGRSFPDGRHEREAERLARCLSSLGPISLDDPSERDLRLTEEEYRRADQELEGLGGSPFIAVNTGGKVAQNDWGEAKWADFLRSFGASAPRHAIVFVGAKEDSARASRLSRVWEGRSLDVCGRLTPRESGALLARATLFIGHDSGPMHLAAAMQVPCVGLFSGFNPPGKWHPIGDRHRLIHEMRGMGYIEVEQVLELSTRALADSRSELGK